MKRSGLAILLAVVFLVGLAVGYCSRGWLDVDRCLDSGGRWNEQYRLCERYVEPSVSPR